MLKSWFDHLEGNILKSLAQISLFLIMVLVTVDAVGRYLFRSPLDITMKAVTQLLFPVVVFFSMSYVFKIGGHVRMEILWLKLSQRVRACLDVLFGVCAAALWLGVAYQTTIRTIEAVTQKQKSIAVFGIPPSVTYSIVVLGCLVMVVRLMMHIFACIGFMSKGRSVEWPGEDAAGPAHAAERHAE